MTSALQLPAGMVSQTLVGFNSVAIENGFILTKNYVVQESNRPPMQIQRTTYFPTLKEVVNSLESDVA